MKLFKKRAKKQTIAQRFESLIKDLNAVFQKINEDVDAIFDNHDGLSKAFYELREELATNGVVRDLRKAEKRIEQLTEQQAELAAFVIDKLNALDNNGVATAINKLNSEVFRAKKSDGSTIGALLAHLSGGEQLEDVTLSGKVDAILDYLKIDVTVQPKQVTPAKIVTSKVKTAKKGRK